MVALAAQGEGEDNFARNDLALFEISAGDHCVEVLENKKKSKVNLNKPISARPSRPGVNMRIIHSFWDFSGIVGDCEDKDSPGGLTRRGVRK